MKLHERQDFQCPAESGTELYAPNCDPSGSRSSAGYRKFLYKCHDNETYGLTAVLGEGTILHALLVIMNKVGSAVFDNLPLIFAVGVAIGMAKKEKEVSALSAVISYFVMNTAINAMLTLNGQVLDNGEIAESVLEGTITYVCGIQSLQMGVFGGIIVGLGVAALHNRFYRIQLPNALSFFGGTRFVPIISTIVYMFVGILMFFVWPVYRMVFTRWEVLSQAPGMWEP